MSAYTAPTANLTIYNSENFYGAGDGSLTQTSADLRYLKLAGGTVTGNLLVKQVLQGNNNFNINTQNIYVDAANNRVGINRTPTSYPLEVGGNSLFVGQNVIRADGSAATPQLSIYGSSNTNRQLLMAYDTTNNYGLIQPIEQGVAYKDLITCPNGGWLRCGNSAQSYVPVVSSSSVKIDYGISNNTNNTGSITFNFTFTSPPNVVVSMIANVANSLYVCNISSITTTGFSWRKQYQQAGSSFGAGSEQFYWIAIGA